MDEASETGEKAVLPAEPPSGVGVLGAPEVALGLFEIPVVGVHIAQALTLLLDGAALCVIARIVARVVTDRRSGVVAGKATAAVVALLAGTDCPGLSHLEAGRAADQLGLGLVTAAAIDGGRRPIDRRARRRHVSPAATATGREDHSDPRAGNGPRRNEHRNDDESDYHRLHLYHRPFRVRNLGFLSN